MSRWTKWLMTIGVLQGLAAMPCAAAEDIHYGSFAQITGMTSVPYGWVDFCRRYAGQCDGPAAAPQDVLFSPQTWREIERINLTVNRAITPMTDMDHWGVVDQWDFPTDGKGDCEDYALWKRKLLIDAGYPRQALLMTVVRDRADQGHAVLTVRTDRGEFVLDNMVDAVLAADETGYRFVKRQSQTDQNVWESIGPAVTAPLYIYTAR